MDETNFSEEITWEDDENRATLFLRSAFVVLSTIILLKTLTAPNALTTITQQLLRLFVLCFALPVCIIWFFFGQGLRPVEWLSDQKYNAWNYGLSFTGWKTHLKWAGILVGLAAVVVLIFQFSALRAVASIDEPLGFLFLCAVTAAVMIALTWLILGYLWFGSAQGFGRIAATVVTAAVVGLIAQPVFQMAPGYTFAAIGFTLVGSAICWRTNSLAPAVYAAIFCSPLIALLLLK